MMPRNPTTGVFTRVSNSFSEPVLGTLLDPTAADGLFDDYDSALSAAVPKEPTIAAAANQSVIAGTTAVAVQRAAPVATGLTLPAVADQNGVPLLIVDYSTAIGADHTITLTPDGAETIMQQATWQMVSTAAELAHLRLIPSTVLGGWYIG